MLASLRAKMTVAEIAYFWARLLLGFSSMTGCFWSWGALAKLGADRQLHLSSVQGESVRRQQNAFSL